MNKKLTFGSLFAGIGGFDLAFERAGMECKWQVEIDDYATKVLEKHWPNVHRERDIRECGKHNLEYVDVICGGFPCQDISYAGKGAGLDGERSGLFFEAVRVIREVGPRIVVLENVAALLNRGLDRALGTLASLGFDAEWHCIQAADVGAPHIRDRVFILAYTEGERFDRHNESKRCEGRDEPSTRFENGRSQAPPEMLSNASQQRLPLPEQEAICRPRRGQEGGAIAQCSWWSTEPNVGRVAHGVSFGLERTGGLEDGKQGGDSEAITEGGIACWQVLREVWKYREAATTSPELFIERMRDFVPNVSCAIGLRRWVAEAGRDKELRDLWRNFSAKPFKEAQDMQRELLKRARASERKQTVAFKKQRVNRLRGYGNAVVPQVAQWIGERIVEATKC